MAWRWRLGLVVFLTLAACSPSPDEPPTVPSDPTSPGGNPNPSDPGNSGSGTPGTSDSGTGTPSNDAGIPNNDAGIPNNDAGIPNNDAGIPNNDAGIPNNDAGIPNNDAGFAASLPPEDCVVWTGEQPPREAAPCEVNRQYHEGATRDRYDAQGNLLEQRLWGANGTLTQVRTRAWSDGLEVFFREERPTTSSWTETVSTFNAQRQLSTQRKRTDSDPAGTLDHYIYVDGRLERIDYTQNGQLTWVERYLYADGRLLRVDLEGRDRVEKSVHYVYDDAGRLLKTFDLFDEGTYSNNGKSFTYHPEGWTQQIEWYTFSSENLEKYDSRGNLLLREWDNYRDNGDSATRDTWVYDENNRVLQRTHDFYGIWGGTLTTWMNRYGAQGQVELTWSFGEKYFNNGQLEVPTRTTVRNTYLCGTALLHHRDTDLDGNGTVDARCTYARNAQGALVREECFRLPADPTYATSTDYRYDCQ